MSYIKCPICESSDVHLNKKNELFCFTCFNLSSSDTKNNQPPSFPENLERRKLRKRELLSIFKNVNHKSFLKRTV